MFQNIPKEKILEILKEGPTVPSKIVKRVGGDTMLIGAILSSLISTGEVSFSSLKIGGSPLYYIPGDEEKLEQFINYLNEKDRRTFNMIKEKKIVCDKELDPLTRVSIRNIKDFAKPFEIENNGEKELYWRFYNFEQQSAINEAKKMSEEKSKSDIKKPITEIAGRDAKDMKEIQYLKGTTDLKEKTNLKGTVDLKEIVDLRKDEEKSVSKIDVSRTETDEEEKFKHSKDIEKKDFYERIKNHIHTLNLDIISKEKIKRTEYNIVLKNHESGEYIYCVAKDKKTINEGDLSTAYVFAQNKKMPCLFITTGKLTKKAEQMRQKEFKEIRIEKIS